MLCYANFEILWYDLSLNEHGCRIVPSNDRSKHFVNHWGWNHIGVFRANLSVDFGYLILKRHLQHSDLNDNFMDVLGSTLRLVLFHIFVLSVNVSAHIIYPDVGRSYLNINIKLFMFLIWSSRLIFQVLKYIYYI